jgi:hypothetical protein
VAVPVRTIINWVIAQGWDASQETGVPLFPGPYIQKMPDRIVTLTGTPGPGFVLESAADAQAFQARVRGPQNDQDAAEALALSLDSLILNAPFPAIAGARTLMFCKRLGGQPIPLAAAPDQAERYEFICSYILIASTT